MTQQTDSRSRIWWKKNEIYIIKVAIERKKFNFDQIFTRTLSKQRNFNSFVFFRLNVLFTRTRMENENSTWFSFFVSIFFYFFLDCRSCSLLWLTNRLFFKVNFTNWEEEEWWFERGSELLDFHYTNPEEFLHPSGHLWLWSIFYYFFYFTSTDRPTHPPPDFCIFILKRLKEFHFLPNNAFISFSITSFEAWWTSFCAGLLVCVLCLVFFQPYLPFRIYFISLSFTLQISRQRPL